MTSAQTRRRYEDFACLPDKDIFCRRCKRETKHRAIAAGTLCENDPKHYWHGVCKVCGLDSLLVLPIKNNGRVENG